MKIVTLLENEQLDKKLKAAHGLSLFIETNTKKILFDLGPNNYYIKNAKQLGIDLTDIDYLVISHGHFDHGSGISKFLKINTKAKVFISKSAFRNHVKAKGSRYHDIGIGKPPKSDRIEYIYRESKEITPGVTLYDLVNFTKQAICDEDLMIYEDGQYIRDHFHHEIYMIIKDVKNTVLFSGCSHKGIENIIDSIEKVGKISITHIFGGLHFSHYDSFDFKQTDYLVGLAEKIKKRKTTKIYACHCTGDDAFFELKKGLKSNIKRIKTGSIVEI